MGGEATLPLLHLRLLAPLLGLYVLVALVGPEFVEEGDEPTYLFYAEQLLDGRYADHDAPEDARYLAFGPGLPLAMAPFVAAGASMELIRLLGALFLFGAVLVFYRLCLLFAPPRVALVAALALGLYPPYLVLTARLVTEPLALLAFVAGLLFAVRYVRGGAGWQLALAGLALGYMTMARVAYGYVLAAMLAITAAWWLVRRRDDLRRWVAVFAASLACCLPWLAYTLSVTGEPFYWGSSGAQSLYWIASPSPGNHGDWRALTDPMAPADRQFLVGLQAFDPLVRYNRTRDEALGNIRDHPVNYVEHVALNIERMVIDVPHSYGDGHGVRALLYAIPNLALIVALALALFTKRSRSQPELGVLAWLAGVIFAVHALLSAEPRMLSLVVPLAILLVAAWQSLDSPPRCATHATS